MDRVRNLLEQIQSRLDDLNKAERKVAEVILHDPQQATRFSIAALAQAAGVSEGTSEVVPLARRGRTSARYSLGLIPRRFEDSMTLAMAATRGPASQLPTWSQFLRPSTRGRTEFSAQLVSSSTSP
jgi:hypothetical protein